MMQLIRRYSIRGSHGLTQCTLITGGDDNTDNNCSSEPYPTYKEVLAALSSLKKHIDLESDPCSSKLDAMLDTNCT
jgi:hypothetical protein